MLQIISTTYLQLDFRYLKHHTFLTELVINVLAQKIKETHLNKKKIQFAATKRSTTVTINRYKKTFDKSCESFQNVL